MRTEVWAVGAALLSKEMQRLMEFTVSAKAQLARSHIPRSV